MAPNLVFVRFKEDSVHWVVALDDVKDFLPKHSDDFDSKKIYPTRWPHLKETAGSFDINEYHDAYIICLGVDEVDIAFKAKQLKKFNKLPLSIITAFKEHENKVKVKGKVKVKAAHEKKESSKEINAKETRREMVSRSRMKASLKDDVKDNVKNNPKDKVKDKGKVKSKEDQLKQAKKKERDRVRFQEGLAALLECQLGGSEEEKINSAVNVAEDPSSKPLSSTLLTQNESGSRKSESVPVAGTPQKTSGKRVEFLDSSFKSPGSISRKGTPLKHSGFIVTPLKESQDDADLDTTLPILNEEEILSSNFPSKRLFPSDDEEPKPKKQKQENSDSADADSNLPSRVDVKELEKNKPKAWEGDSDSDDSDSNSSSDVEVIKSKGSKPKKRKPDSNSDDADSNSSSKVEVKELGKNQPKTRVGDSDSDDSDSNSSSDVEVIKSKGSKPKKRKPDSNSDDSDSSSSYTPSEEMLKKSQELVAELQKKVLTFQRNDRTLQNQLSVVKKDNEELRNMNLDLQRKLYKVEKESKKIQKESKVHTSSRGNSDENQKSISFSDEKLKIKPSPDVEEKVKKIQQEASIAFRKEKSNQEIGDMIHKAMTNPEDNPLREDDNGMINLGNRVWVPKSLFEDKLSKLSVKTSIAVGDLMEYMWGKEGMASRSLDGGVSPKTPAALRKSAATPAKREVALGLYRARKMIDGLKDLQGLDMAVDMEGKKILREKFSRSSKSFKKAAEAVRKE